MTRKDVARASRIKENRIEDLEAGIETWLSVTDRQLIAKALGIEPLLLQDVEKRPDLGSSVMYSTDVEIGKRILEGARDLECPKCGGNLNCRVEQGFDIEGNVIHMAKAFCVKCRYTIR